MLAETLTPAQQCDRAGRAITQQLAWEARQPRPTERTPDILAEATEHVLLGSVDQERVATDPVYRSAVLSAYESKVKEQERTIRIYREAYYGAKPSAATGSGRFAWTEGYQSTQSDRF